MTRLRQAILERLKTTVMVWLAVYPSVLLIIWLVGDRTQNWPLPLRVLGATLMIVPIVTSVSLPTVRTVVGKMEKAIVRWQSRNRL
ncbi:antibiotic biosynthesis monooxygenase domain-containing protein (plasmid) [Rhizobium sp. N541]|nr:antibiotic biosynthesis monooxygenase domain-containing protein [Rhizobium sp. N541]ANM26091.1 antibiotic biosynthesis monooxygenase domain-containing protein [Rhizobium sp. N941]